MTASHTKPASMAAPKSHTFPMNPAVGGMPPSDSMKKSMAKAIIGLRRESPVRSFSSSPTTSLRRIAATTANAPSCMKR